VRGQIAQGDFGSIGCDRYEFTGRRVALEGIGERELAVIREPEQEVGGEDLGKRTEADQGVGVGCAGAARERFAVVFDHGFVVADYDEDHAGEAGLLKEGLTLEGGVG